MWNRIISLLTFVAALTMSTTPLLASAQDSASLASAARADIQKTLGFVPRFFAAFPDTALPGAWQEMKGLQLNPGTALSGEAKELIGLAVAAQVPCLYCVYAHTEFAELNGADAQERAEAVAIGGMERHWSAYFYGLQNDPEAFRAEIAKLVAAAKQNKPSPKPIQVVDAATARQDIVQTLGFMPEFLRRVPEGALPGAWREMKELKLNPSTRVSAKHKALISLAVASQVPSAACVMAETEFAKLAGATDREIAEAVGMAAITRNMSTQLNGLQVDMRSFVADIDKLVAGVKASAKASAKKAATAKTDKVVATAKTAH